MPVTPAPEPFSIPATLVDADITRLNPEPVIFYNAEYTLRCADVPEAGPVGADVVIEAGEESDTLVWPDVPDINSSQLDRIARDVDLAADLAALDLTASQISDRTGLTASQAAYVQGVVTSLKQGIQRRVETAALAVIRCVFVNASISVACPDAGALQTGASTDGDTAGVMNPSVVLPGSVESENSQAEANALATTLAYSALVCLYGNDAMTVTCLDKGFTEPVPVDPEDKTGRRRVGEFFVAANTAVRHSKNAANAAARAAGLAILDCFYESEAVQVDCQGLYPDSPGFYLSPSTTTAALPGNPVFAQEGEFIAEGSEASTAAATELARQAALALLDCRFRNTEQIVRCEAVIYGGVTYPPQSDTKVVVIPEGTVESTSVEDANRLAREMALLQLGCLYCNAYVPPTCYPDTYELAEGAAIPAADVTPDWSTSVTLGLAAGVICSSDLSQVQPVADAVARQPAQPADASCQYENDEMWFGCLSVLPGTFTPPRGGYFAPAYPGNSALPPGYEATPLIDQLSPYSLPDPAAAQPYIVLPAGSYVIGSDTVPPGTDPKAHVNALARLYGLSLLSCQFANPVMDMRCDNAFTPAFEQEEVAQSDGQLVELNVPRARFESAFSFADAIEKARAFARSLLQCYYENPDVHMRCWPEADTPGAMPPKMPVPGFVYGTGEARRTWVAGDITHTADEMLQSWQPGSTSLPAFIGRGQFTSNTSAEAALTAALVAARSLLDCAGQAQDNLVCNAPLRVFCGARVEPNPAYPNVEGTNEFIEENITVGDGGVVRMGNGHNYTMSRQGSETTPWGILDLGPSGDPVGGVNADGLEVPACIVSARTQDEANKMAYILMRGALACASENITAEISGMSQGGAPGSPGQDGAQTNCTSTCLAVYS